MKDIILKQVEFLDGQNFIYGGKVPIRMCWLDDSFKYKEKTAYSSLKDFCGMHRIKFSDIYRSPASSAEAYARKTGVAKPGYSGHNYGISVDVAVDDTLKINNWSYQQLVNMFINHHWTPFQGLRARYERGKEDWHFNFAGTFGETRMGSAVVNGWIDQNYIFSGELRIIQGLLQSLKFYQGKIDGMGGPLTTEAIKKFNHAWQPKLLGVSGKLDELTIRLIHIVSCNVKTAEGNLII